MARNLLRIARATKDDTYRDRGIRTVKTFALAMQTSPTSMPAMLRALDELLDAADKTDPPAPKDKPKPKTPKESADTLTAKLALTPAKDGTRTFTVTLVVETPWHLYANPVGFPMLLDSQTEVSVYVGGKKVDAKVMYPKGKEIAEATGEKYFVYDGTVKITGTFPAGDGEVEVRVSLSACKEGLCLPPSTLKLK